MCICAAAVTVLTTLAGRRLGGLSGNKAPVCAVCLNVAFVPSGRVVVGRTQNNLNVYGREVRRYCISVIIIIFLLSNCSKTPLCRLQQCFFFQP